MKIGQLAKITGCSIHTIRYYEKEGLLKSPHRSEGNFRIYDQKALDELEFIKHCRCLDIPLHDVKALLALKKNPQESCASIKKLISHQLILVNKRITELTSLRTELQMMNDSCSSEKTVEQCGILKTLASQNRGS